MKRIRLEDLQSGVNYVDDLLILKQKNGLINVCKNKCKHMGGRFGKCLESNTVKCRRHNWKLNLQSLEYTSPVGLRQSPIPWHLDGDEIVIDDCGNMATEEVHTLENLSPKEFTIRFYSHACIEIRWKDNSFFTDPWLVGPAFTKGWWLSKPPPLDWLDKVQNCDGIYISHNHSDHLNSHTLDLIVKKNPTLPIYIPKFDSNSMYDILNNIGFKNINVVNFQQKINLNGLYFTIYQDTAGKDDSGIVFDYKGHRILNTVDCKDLKSYNISNVKVLLKEFSSGATGYPVCWEEQYSISIINKLVKRNMNSIRNNVFETVERFNPSLFVPFAGYFDESYPTDKHIKQLNKKNKPEDINRFLKSKVPNLKTWSPSPGDELDLSDLSITKYAGGYYTDREKSFYAKKYKNGRHVEIFDSISKFQEYFGCLSFNSDLVLHIIEMDENYTHCKNEFYVDFSDSAKISQTMPEKQGRVLVMKVRSDVFRYVLYHGLPWEEFSIGFQAQFKRTPDEYNLDFWNYMQNKLPTNQIKKIKDRNLS